MQKLYRDKKGILHFSTIDYPALLVGKFGAELLKLLGEQDELLKDAFFVHELRGTKSSSHHNPRNADEREASMNGVLDLFDVRLLKPEQWVVDIGLEIRQEGCVLQWLTDAHHRILAHLLPSASEEQISAVLNSRTQYHCDLSAQLQELGGFRVSPGSRGKADQVSYINIYSTDKCATYQLHDGVFRRRKPWHLFPCNISKIREDMKRIGDTFVSCANDGLEGNARMEIRIPLSLANSCLVDLPYNVIKTTVASFACKTIW